MVGTLIEGLDCRRRLRITSQTVSSTLTRAYRLQLDSTIVHGAYGVVVRCNISSTASRYLSIAHTSALQDEKNGRKIREGNARPSKAYQQRFRRCALRFEERCFND